MVWLWATALYGLVLSTRVPDALVQTRNFRFSTSSSIYCSPSFSWRPRVCSPVLRDDWKKKNLRNGLLFSSYCKWRRTFHPQFLFNTHFLKRGKYVDCEWKALLTLATWGESHASDDAARTWHLCRNVLSLLNHLFETCSPFTSGPCVIVCSWFSERKRRSLVPRARLRAKPLSVRVFVCVWLLTRVIYICILLLLLATGSGSKHLLTSLSYLAVLQHIT